MNMLKICVKSTRFQNNHFKNNQQTFAVIYNLLNDLHQFLLGALRTDDVILIGDESTANQAGLANGTEEAIVVPVSVFERDELGATNSCDGFVASVATFGKQFAKAVGAVRLVVATGEAGTS